MHLGSILTNSNSRVGQNCAIHINTSLVANGVSNGTPQLGDDIVIGVGTNIVGNIKIANGIAIGANSLVNKSFDENDICIAGVPAKKISNNGRKNWGTKIETY
jgi:serine O-acetyltransferase